jgi:hypothetical protein
MTADALSDTPVAAIFESLYFAFPTARFIYTERGISAWVSSMAGYFKWLRDIRHLQEIVTDEKIRPGLPGSYHWRFIHLNLYGHSDSWEDAYIRHEARVLSFFSGEKSSNLLRIDLTDTKICDETKWWSIVDFIGVDREKVPLVPFPHRNIRKDMRVQDQTLEYKPLPPEWNIDASPLEKSQTPTASGVAWGGRRCK